jgi:hypothetical protein
MTDQRIGWRLTLEPVGVTAVAWALTRATAASAVPVGGGLFDGIAHLRALAAGLTPHVIGDREGTGLWSGPLAVPEKERSCAVDLGLGLLPPALRDELLASPADTPHTVTIACRGWLACIPWEALALDRYGNVRLVERARIAAGFSPVLAADRERPARPRADASALRVLDPGPRTGSTLLPLYPEGYPMHWYADGVLADSEDLVPDGSTLSVAGFGALLRDHRGWSRLLYLGHALPGTSETPSAAALVFGTPGGSDTLSAHAWLSDPGTWPAPSRVALIACASDDSGHLEQAGLPVAAINAGAELLTVTRWILPTDYDPPREIATTMLALAVDCAHREPDPLAALRSWQCERLTAWREHGWREDAPLLWASLATYVVSDHVSEDG